jgi:hypothetical protein
MLLVIIENTINEILNNKMKKKVPTFFLFRFINIAPVLILQYHL